MSIKQRLREWGERLSKTAPVEVGRKIGEHSVMSLSAALAYYTIISLAPLVTLLLWLTTTLYPAAQQEFFSQAGALAGPQVENAARLVVENAERRPGLGSMAALLGTLALIFASSIVFGHLQLALNRIFGSPSVASQGIWAWIRKRLLSLGMVFGLGFLLVISMVAQAGMEMVANSLPGAVPIVVSIVAVALYTLAFAAIYRFVPDCSVTTRLAMIGGFMTALMFVVGRELIGLYLGRADMGSAYGPAGGLVVLLVWIYYCAVVFFIGAVATAVMERRLEVRKRLQAGADRRLVDRRKTDDRRLHDRAGDIDRRSTARDDDFGGMQPA